MFDVLSDADIKIALQGLKPTDSLWLDVGAGSPDPLKKKQDLVALFGCQDAVESTSRKTRRYNGKTAGWRSPTG